MRLSELGVLGPILGWLSQHLENADALMVSSALGHGPLDRIAAALAHVRHVRFSPWYDPAFEQIGNSLPGDEATFSTRVLLSDADLDLVVRLSPLERAATGGASESFRKLRRLDGLFGPVAPAAGRVGVLCIAESGHRMPAVLEGASELLASHRPAVLLPVNGASGAPAVTLLYRAGYRLHDQHLQVASHSRAVASSWMLALHGNSADSEIERFSRVAFSESRDPSARTSWTIPIDNLLPKIGFKPTEGLEPLTWAWIGPRPAASLLLPTWAGRLERIRLQLRAVADGIDPARTMAMVDGVPASVHFVGRVMDVLVPDVPGPHPFRRLDLSFPRVAQENMRLFLAIETAQLDFVER